MVLLSLRKPKIICLGEIYSTKTLVVSILMRTFLIDDSALRAICTQHWGLLGITTTDRAIIIHLTANLPSSQTTVFYFPNCVFE